MRLHEWFMAPQWLLLLLVPAGLVLGYMICRRDKREIALATLSGRPLGRTGRGLWAHVVPALLLVGLALLVVQLARPIGHAKQPTEEAVLMYGIDVSGSMLAEDCTDGTVVRSRMDCVKSAVTRSLGNLPSGVAAGLVVFSDEAATLVPPTVDTHYLSGRVESLQPSGGTASGDAIAEATFIRENLPVGSNGEPVPFSLVLLSDGARTAGEMDVAEAAAQAVEAEITVYTIAFGQSGTAVNIPGSDFPVDATPDAEAMAMVAELSGTTPYTAESVDALSEIYSEIVGQFGTETVTTTVWWAMWAASGCLLVGMVLWFILNRRPRGSAPADVSPLTTPSVIGA